jgi:hypothetical protein
VLAGAGQTFQGNYGKTIAGLGDVNGDGFADVAVGAPGEGSGGRVYVYAGSAAGLVQSPMIILPGGLALAMADFNGDGFSDLAVASASTVVVYLGASNGLPSVASMTIANSSTAAFALSSPGDFDGNGYADLLVGNSVNPGTISLFLGGAGGPPATASDVFPAPTSGGFGVLSLP